MLIREPICAIVVETNQVESLNHNKLAAAMDPKNQPAWWNLGIAATALGDWKTARQAWRGFGIDVPDGDGPLDLPAGYCPIRLHPDGEAEVVWARRIDPARAVLASIPFPESGFRWGDTVLNDGAATGYRIYGGQEFPVFNALELLEVSLLGTFLARVKMPEGSDCITKLARYAEDAGGAAEDWSMSVQLLCKACSEGRPHEAHDTLKKPADDIHLIGIAVRNAEQAEHLIARWRSEFLEIQVESMQEMLAPAKGD
ncbi:MAG TPA: hypothetical protein VE988_10845 [Gemmataceae bacterium]|nr:hypothetical protein [Gemmataceae bacterium]